MPPKRIIKEEFSEARIALMREVNKHHPALCELLTVYPPDDWGGQVGEIAAFCGVIMDGYYMPHELERLYDILYARLRAVHTHVIALPQPTDPTLH